MRDLELSKYNTLELFEEARQKLHMPSCFNFSPDLMYFRAIICLFFLTALINWMIGSSNSQLYNKNSCSVKFQCRPLDHNPRNVSVENTWLIILQNNSKYLFLNDKQMPHKLLYSLLHLLEEIQNTKKMKTRESKERKF